MKRKLSPRTLGGIVAALILVYAAGGYFMLVSPKKAEAKRLDEDPPELPRSPSGRVDRTAADELFDRRRVEVEAAPEDWRRWYRLAVAYDLAGDRRRARAAMRTAIARADDDGAVPGP